MFSAFRSGICAKAAAVMHSDSIVADSLFMILSELVAVNMFLQSYILFVN